MSNCSSYGEINMRKDFTSLRRLRITIARKESQLRFLTACRRRNITPKSLEVRRLEASPQSSRILENCNRKLVKAAIDEKYKEIEDVTISLYKHHLQVASKYTPTIMMRELSIVDREIKRLTKTLEIQKNKKLNFLSSQRTIQRKSKPENVSYMNLSSKQLPSAIESILKRGPKYAFNNNRDIKTIVLAAEKVVQAVPSEDKDLLRLRMARVIDKHFASNKRDIINTSKNIKAIKSWSRENNVKILKADKSQDIVIMDEADHNQKVNEYITKTACKILKRDPTKAAITEVNNALSDPSFPEELRNNAAPNKYSTIPLLFTQAKTHKPNVPVRPMVARYTAPTYKLEKQLTAFLSQYVFDKDYIIKSTKDFVTKVKSKLSPEMHMASLDVVQLYPSTPVSTAIDLVTKRLEEKGVEHNKIAAVIRALKICANYNVFRHNGMIYKQTQGTPIGSAISVILSEIVLQKIEEIVLAKPEYQNITYFRYVDDIFVLVPDASLTEKLAKDMSEVYNSINLTYEEENENNIAFLDVLIHRKEDKHILSVYRKDTSKPIFIPATSSHPLPYKMSAFKWLYNRAEIISTDEESYRKEIDNINKIATAHGYSVENIHKWLDKPSNRNDERRQTISFPYIQGLSETIARMTKNYKIRISHTNRSTIFNFIRNDRDQIDSMLKPAVYSIPIKNLTENRNYQYIGESGKSTKLRVKQHIADVKRGEMKNSIYKFITENNAIPLWSEAKVLRNCNNRADRQKLESFEIYTATNTVNTQDGVYIPAIWRTILQTYK